MFDENCFYGIKLWPATVVVNLVFLFC